MAATSLRPTVKHKSLKFPEVTYYLHYHRHICSIWGWVISISSCTSSRPAQATQLTVQIQAARSQKCTVRSCGFTWCPSPVPKLFCPCWAGKWQSARNSGHLSPETNREQSHNTSDPDVYTLLFQDHDADTGPAVTQEWCPFCFVLVWFLHSLHFFALNFLYSFLPCF